MRRKNFRVPRRKCLNREETSHIFPVMRTIADIIEAAGGPHVVGKATGREAGALKWAANGIPYRHWPKVMELVPGLTADEILQANLALLADEAVA